MKHIKDSLFNWFYSTALGGLYFELLLWIDKKSNNSTKYLTPKEMAQIIRESSQVTEGIVIMKQKVNQLIRSKSKSEYQEVLIEIGDLIPYSELEAGTDKAKFAEILRQIYIKKGNKDVVTATDKAKMIDQRIQDMHELHAHINKRNLLRAIRSARTSGNVDQANKLEQEFINKYGGSNSRYR